MWETRSKSTLDSLPVGCTQGSSGFASPEQSKIFLPAFNDNLFNDRDGGTDIKFLVEEEEELEAVTEEEDGDDGYEQVGQILLPPLT